MLNSKLALASLIPLALSSACVVVTDDDRRNPPPPSTIDHGTLTVEFNFEGRLCDVAGVDIIDVDVIGQTMGDAYRDSLNCQNYRDGLVIEDLRVDDYEVSVTGKSNAGDVLYETETFSVVRVGPTANNLITVDALGLGGDLTVYWTFEGRGLCGDIFDVRVTTRDPDGFIYDDALYPCDFGGVVYEHVIDGLWTVDVDALDDTGRLLYQTYDRGVVVIRNANNDYTLDLDRVR